MYSQDVGAPEVFLAPILCVCPQLRGLCSLLRVGTRFDFRSLGPVRPAKACLVAFKFIAGKMPETFNVSDCTHGPDCELLFFVFTSECTVQKKQPGHL